jgi:hypothetical protein
MQIKLAPRAHHCWVKRKNIDEIQAKFQPKIAQKESMQ